MLVDDRPHCRGARWHREELTVVVTVVHLKNPPGVLDGRLVLSTVGGRDDNVEQQPHVAPGLDQTPEMAVDLAGGFEALLAVKLHDCLVGIGDGEKQKLELLAIGKVGAADGIAEGLQSRVVSANCSGKVRLRRGEIRVRPREKPFDLIDGTALGRGRSTGNGERLNIS